MNESYLFKSVPEVCSGESVKYSDWRWLKALYRRFARIFLELSATTTLITLTSNKTFLTGNRSENTSKVLMNFFFVFLIITLKQKCLSFRDKFIKMRCNNKLGNIFGIFVLNQQLLIYQGFSGQLLFPILHKCLDYFFRQLSYEKLNLVALFWKDKALIRTLRSRKHNEKPIENVSNAIFLKRKPTESPRSRFYFFDFETKTKKSD
jgi:hypothetical protein